MLRKVKEQSGQKSTQKPTAALADNGYLSEENLRGAAKMRVEAYVAVSKQKHPRSSRRARGGRIPQTATPLERMRRKLQTMAGRALTSRICS